MNRATIDALRSEINAFAARAEKLIGELEASLPSEEPAPAPAPAATAPTPAAQPTAEPAPEQAAPPATTGESQADIDNPWITRDPQAWKGPSYAGMRADQCPIDYLETVVAAYGVRTRAYADKGNQAMADQNARAALIIDKIIARKKLESAGRKGAKAGA